MYLEKKCSFTNNTTTKELNWTTGLFSDPKQKVTFSKCTEPLETKVQVDIQALKIVPATKLTPIVCSNTALQQTDIPIKFSENVK